MTFSDLSEILYHKSGNNYVSILYGPNGTDKISPFNGHLKIIDTIENTYMSNNGKQPKKINGGYYNTYLKNKNEYIKLKKNLYL